MTSSDTPIYDEKKDPWYSPIDVINYFELLRSIYGKNVENTDFKKAQEMFGAAVALLGVYELSPDNKYWQQHNYQSVAPDVMTAKLTESKGKPVQLEVNQVEVTEFESHYPSDDIVEFLSKVKLSKPYDYRTIIICLINRVLPVDHRKISEQLFKIKPKFSIFVFGRPYGEKEGVFTIFSPYPRLTKVVQYNVNITANKYTLLSPMNFNRGPTNKISFEKIQITPRSVYEILGLDEKRIKAKYGKVRVNKN